MRSEKQRIRELAIGDRAFVKLHSVAAGTTTLGTDPDTPESRGAETRYQEVRVVETNREEGYLVVSRGTERMVCEPAWLSTYAPDELVRRYGASG